MTDKTGILDIAPIAEAIRVGVPDLRHVGTAKSFGALTRESIVSSSAYVIPLAESSGGNRYTTDAMLSQRVLARFGVLWVVRDIGDRVGSIAQGAITAVRPAGMLAICKFRPDGAESACEPAGGKLVSGVDRNGQMIWQDDFVVPLNRFIAIP